MVEFMMMMMMISKCSNGAIESVAQWYVCLSFGRMKYFTIHNNYYPRQRESIDTYLQYIRNLFSVR